MRFAVVKLAVDHFLDGADVLQAAVVVQLSQVDPRSVGFDLQSDAMALKYLLVLLLLAFEQHCPESLQCLLGVLEGVLELAPGVADFGKK